ncbi:MAG: DUF385 domain-containing protein [Pseudomonadales bacterium]|nr:DUF385 domain-containing protein [Pseudomonadales bacterium]
MRTTVLLLCALLTGCSEENMPFSSGELTGVVTPAPADWTEIASVEVVQFETRAPDAYSVNLWVLGQGDRLYVFAGGSRSNWVEHIEVNPNVRMKIGAAIYELTASQVHDADEFEVFAQGWEAKYGNRPWNDDVSETYLLRLSPSMGEDV